MKKQFCVPHHARKSMMPTKSERGIETATNRKASTPTSERTSDSVSPDISCILNNDPHKPNTTKPLGVEKHNASKKLFKNPVTTKKDDSVKIKLDLEYTRYLQSVFKNKLNEAKSSDLDNQLENIQQRIERNQDVLQKTTRRLKNINFNKEIDLLHSLNNTNYGHALEKLDSSNCEEYLSNLHDKLKQSTNQLRVENIEMPEGGAAQLVQVITDTVEAFEKVKSDNDAETWNTLKNIEESNKITSSAIARCWERIPVMEDMLLTNSTTKLCNKD